MSNFLSVATVTSTLKQVVQEAVGPKIPGATVTTVRPGSSENGTQTTKANIYLYQVKPNKALRNMDLPTRRSDGSLIQKPQAALDLFYLFSFYGDETNQEPQRMLGSVVGVIHANPVLTPAAIRTTTDSIDYLNDSDLADSVESIKLTPISFSLEEMFKIWSVFQAPFALSIAYQASVVLIESDDAVPQAALPVSGE